MSGLATYHQSMRVQSELVGYAIRQAGAVGFLTDAQVVAATTVQDLIDDVNNAVVAAGAEPFSQRNSITRALTEGATLGDLSDSRIQAATSLADLVDKTWCTSSDPRTGHLAVNLLP